MTKVKMLRTVKDNGYSQDLEYPKDSIQEPIFHGGYWRFIHGHGVYTEIFEGKDFEFIEDKNGSTE